MFLTDADVRELTGYRRYSKQRELLHRNAIPFFVAASGRPIVLKADLEKRTIARPDGPKTHPRLRLATATPPPRR